MSNKGSSHLLEDKSSENACKIRRMANNKLLIIGRFLKIIFEFLIKCQWNNNCCLYEVST